MKLALFLSLMSISSLSYASEEFSMTRSARLAYDSCEGVPVPNLEREAKLNTTTAAKEYCESEITQISNWSIKTERFHPNLAYVCIDQTIATATFQCL